MFQYLRLVRLPGPNAPCADERRTSLRLPLNNTFVFAVCMALAAVLVHSAPVRAASDEVIDGVAAAGDLGGTSGMPASNPRVSGILAAHPNEFVVICVAGCDGKPKAVQFLPKPVVTRQGEVMPSSADMSKSVYGPPKPGSAQAKTEDDVVCLAGCSGRPGQVLQRFADLPAPVRRAPKKKDEEQDAPKPDTQKKSDDSIWDDLIP